MNFRTQEHFSKHDKPEDDIYGCTHLIYVKPEGAKYEKAIEWNIPAVNVNWLLQCALTLKKVDENQFKTPLISDDDGILMSFLHFLRF